MILNPKISISTFSLILINICYHNKLMQPTKIKIYYNKRHAQSLGKLSKADNVNPLLNLPTFG